VKSAKSALGHSVWPDTVEVWTVRQDAAEVQANCGAYELSLPQPERDRATRFVQPADRQRFVIGRTLVRAMLSDLAAHSPSPTRVAPTGWSIVIDERGRPHLGEPPPRVPDLRFNLSHTDGLIACAVTVGREVGVDVEHLGRTLTHDVAERFFSAREVRDLRARRPAERQQAFFDYWTLKEAYIKARGLGLALPLGQFTFLLDADAPPTIEFASELPDDPRSWQFAQRWITPRHRLAVAVRRLGEDLPIVLSDVVPPVAP